MHCWMLSFAHVCNLTIRNTVLDILDLSQEAVGPIQVATLHLSNAFDSAEAANWIMECLENASTTSLTMTDCHLDCDVLGFLHTATYSGSALKILNLTSASIGDTGCCFLDKIVRRTDLTALSLSNNGITDHGAASLADALSANTTIRHLDLGHNLIRRAGAAGLLKC
ncbi:Aste57867_10221 [Aphanomyces stellatus]|uniref:Aste57867_10221 protein n=1 Tax=Aphanomyces stellatus TaxID=120398 RepID=A0A485KQA5_9STRA|nr:hypothetical protein As57867_010182 [Aphanomyces stellatus]VFT87096.1 Aste57867_10221 [Aphanomyces stellatus]